MSNVKEKTLSIEEKVFLKLYKEMYGLNYDIYDDKKTDGIRTTHIKGQKVIFPFLQYGVPVGDYYFEWADHGPHSESLRLLMHGLDQRNVSVIEKFYSSEEYNNIFSTFQKNKIKMALDKFASFVNKNINNKLSDKQIVHNAEIISSFIFLSRVQFRSEGFDKINDELAKRKNWTTKEKNTKEIWNCLADIKLVPMF